MIVHLIAARSHIALLNSENLLGIPLREKFQSLMLIEMAGVFGRDLKQFGGFK